ncbi:YwgA family protein [Bacillus sp. H-16]|uniref:YwgA family protein n=1 Tax=Alteribacter salitolerans TaxID=2912333 RepID=UPI001964AFE6|nr:YwgA family protein [Alteribacter salitolerans]MBM7095532.1 YwgA family protein [Alteribacter salitolerans]
MLNEHAKLLSLIQQAGEIVGRKKLQKIVYIVKKLDLPFYEKYQFRMYGPYSEELSVRMEEMRDLGFISEVKEDKSSYHQFRYSLTEKGEEFLTISDFEFPDPKEMLDDLNSKSSRFLELVSTMFYFEDLSNEEIKQKVFTIKAKQNYTEEEVEEAFSYIKALRQTKVN